MSAPASLKQNRTQDRTRQPRVFSGADTPTPAEIRAARKRVGLTQAEAAALAGYGSQSRWAEIESGTKRIDPIRWRYWLHVAGLKRIP